MKESDVTTITENSKIFAERMFAIMTPKPITEIINGVDTGINGLNTGITQLDDSIIELRSAYDGIGEGITGMESAIASHDYLAAIDSRKTVIEDEFQRTLNDGFKQVYWTVAIASVLALVILAFYKNQSIQIQE